MSPAHRGRYVAYYRVSTDRQGKTALGIDDQKKKVLDYLDGGKWSLLAAFTEVESGKRGDRPELRKALDYCKRNKGAKLIVATLSRLTRDAKFLSPCSTALSTWYSPTCRKSPLALWAASS